MNVMNSRTALVAAGLVMSLAIAPAAQQSTGTRVRSQAGSKR